MGTDGHRFSNGGGGRSNLAKAGVWQSRLILLAAFFILPWNHAP
jgi:hypothetical protein